MEQEDLKKRFLESIIKMSQLKVLNELTEYIEGERMVLFCIASNPQGISPSTLSAMLQVSRARITKILASLEEKKYITINHNKEDRRRIEAILTEEGQLHIEEKRRLGNKYLQLLFDQFGELQMEKVISIIIKMTEILENVNMECIENEQNTNCK